MKNSNSVANQDTEMALRKILSVRGYSLSRPRTNGELGVDLVAIKGNENIQVEIIGYKKSGPTRARDFFEVFFRILSRLGGEGSSFVIALPKAWSEGLRRRATVYYREAWRRLSVAFPEVEIWLVDASSVEKTLLKDWVE